jgi:drug/metabolite transporter (DMT)-like permease
VNKDDRIYEIVANHAYRRSWASIVGIWVGVVGILFAILGGLAQGFNPMAAGYGVFVFLVSLAMK